MKLENAIVGVIYGLTATDTFKFAQVNLANVKNIGVASSGSGYKLTPSSPRQSSTGEFIYQSATLECSVSILKVQEEDTIEHLQKGPASFVFIVLKNNADWSQGSELAFLEPEKVLYCIVTKPSIFQVEEVFKTAAGNTYQIRFARHGKNGSELIKRAEVSAFLLSDILIDFSVSEPNQSIAASAPLVVSPVSVSSGSMSYGAFSTSFEGIQFLQSAGDWMQTQNPQTAKHFSFNIQTTAGWQFSLLSLSVMVRSTSAGPTAMALLCENILLDNVATPNTGTPVLVLSAGQTALATFGKLSAAEIKIAGYDGQNRLSNGNGGARIAAIRANAALIRMPVSTGIISFQSQTIMYNSAKLIFSS